jgi:hypothetical protein
VGGDFVHQNSADGLLYQKKKLMPLFGKPRFERIEYFFPENITIRFITDEVAMILARTPLRHVEMYMSNAMVNGFVFQRTLFPYGSPDLRPPHFQSYPNQQACRSIYSGKIHIGRKYSGLMILSL